MTIMELVEMDVPYMVKDATRNQLSAIQGV